MSSMFRMKNHHGDKCKKWEEGQFKLFGEQSWYLGKAYCEAVEEVAANIIDD